MNLEFLNIYNNIVKLTRNKKLYLNLGRSDEFSDRLIFLFLHFALFLKHYKSQMTKDRSQKLFDFFIRQVELSIRETGHGDVTVNKKMKEYVNLFYSILEKIEIWESLDKIKKTQLIGNFMNIKEDNDLIIDYFDKYREFILKNPLKNFTKDILELKF